MSEDAPKTDRRGFLANTLMWTGLALGYGAGAFAFLKYLVPVGAKTKKRELFVGPVDELEVGQSRLVRSPSGSTYLMARTAEGFRVLSDICPHLGCRVHWVPDKEEFFCPCHQGIFDAEGIATGGPPAEANQRLEQLETLVRGGSVFVLIKEV